MIAVNVCVCETPFTLRVYGDVVIEHVDFYGSVHRRHTASSYGDNNNMLGLISAACCVVLTATDGNAIVPIDNNGKSSI